jgi:hypothetical protein
VKRNEISDQNDSKKDLDTKSATLLTVKPLVKQEWPKNNQKKEPKQEQKERPSYE